MRVAGLLLLLAGWALVICAIVLLASLAARTGFVLAGIGVEILGFVLLARTYVPEIGRRGAA